MLSKGLRLADGIAVNIMVGKIDQANKSFSKLSLYTIALTTKLYPNCPMVKKFTYISLIVSCCKYF